MRASPLDDKNDIHGGKKNRHKAIVEGREENMKDSFSAPISMLRDDTNHLQEELKTPDYRLISNPFDPPSSVHLKQRLASFSIFNEVCTAFGRWK